MPFMPFFFLLLATACGAQNLAHNRYTLQSHHKKIQSDSLHPNPSQFPPPPPNRLNINNTIIRRLRHALFQSTDTPEAIVIRFFSDYTPNACHNIASIFSNGQDGQRDATCASNDPDSCPNGFMPMLIDNYSPETNYSYSLLYYPSDEVHLEAVGFPGFTLKVYPPEDCEEAGEMPWFSWGGCEDEEVCKELPYSVASFRLEVTDEGDLDECRLEAEHGGGVRGMEASFGAALLAVAGLMVFW